MGYQTGGELLGDSSLRLGCVQVFLVGVRVHMRLQVLPCGRAEAGPSSPGLGEDVGRSKASREEASTEVKGGAIREGHSRERRSGLQGEVPLWV